jgi:hypothetical protein
VVEILFRDIEYLTEKYLTDMRKVGNYSLSPMLFIYFSCKVLHVYCPEISIVLCIRYLFLRYADVLSTLLGRRYGK